MHNILSTNVSDETVNYFKLLSKENFSKLSTEQCHKLIRTIFNNLRVDNNIPILNDEKFQFTCSTAGNWNEEEQTFSISYSNFTPDTSKIISTIFHEFRHCWQYHNKLELDNLMQQNLDGPITDDYTEYHIQPIEQDAFKFEHDAVCFIAEQLNNEELLNYANIEYNKFLKGLDSSKQILKNQKYEINNKFLEKIFKFRKDRLINNEKKPEFEFKFEKYNIQFTIKNDELYYAIIEHNFADKEDLILSGSMKDNKCIINDIIYPKSNLDKSVFNELLDINSQIVNFYNQKFNKNIGEISFNLKFWLMSKSEHNTIIDSLKNIKSKNNVIQSFFDKYLEMPRIIDFSNVNKNIQENFINAINNVIDNFDIEPIINKILDLEPLKKIDFLLLKSKCNNLEINVNGEKYFINSLSNEELLNLFQKITTCVENIEQIFNTKTLTDNFSEYIKFKNERNLETVLENARGQTTQEQNIERNNQNIDELNR